MQAESRKPSPGGPGGANSNGQSNGAPESRPVSGGHDEHAVPVDLPPVSNRAAILIALVVVILFAGLFAVGWFPHTARLHEARAEAAEAASDKPIVDVTKLKRAPATLDLVLPGNIEAYQTTAIFARTNGYLDPLPAGIDIGAEVEKGDTIATISAPEIDAELEQAKATLQQAEVTVGRAKNEYEYNKGTYDRYIGLSKTGGVTEQQLAEKKASFNIAESSSKAAAANKAAATAALQRLQAMKGFQTVTAPFDGVITARGYDAGALVTATPGSTGKELFRLAQVNRLRVFVDVPQTYATDVQVGQEATLSVRNYPGREFKGVVARASGAIDPATRTMKVEVDIDIRRPDEKLELPFGQLGHQVRTLLRPAFDNTAKRELVPGMFAQIRFKIGRGEPPLLIPTSALIFNAEGSRVAVVDGKNKVHYKTVVIGRDFGQEAEVATGLDGNDQVVLNPGERLAEGVEVEIHRAKPQAGASKPAK